MALRFIFDQYDERTVLDELTRHQEKAELISQRYAQQGQARSAAKWSVLAQREG